MTVTKNVWSNPYWLMNHRVRNSPMTTDMNAIASSKHGQSSTGSGCLCTQSRQNGITTAGTVEIEFEVVQKSAALGVRKV